MWTRQSAKDVNENDGGGDDGGEAGIRNANTKPNHTIIINHADARTKRKRLSG